MTRRCVIEDVNGELAVVRCQLGDRSAWPDLVARWHGPLWTFLRRMVGDAARSDDLEQEVWLRVVRGLPRLEATDRFPAWLFTLARRVVHDELRRAYRSVPTDPDVAPDEAPEVTDHDGLGDLLDRLRLDRALEVLAPRDREAVVLFHLVELPLTDVAHVTRVPIGTVKSRLHRARHQLREELDDDEELPR